MDGGVALWVQRKTAVNGRTRTLDRGVSNLRHLEGLIDTGRPGEEAVVELAGGCQDSSPGETTTE